MKRTSLLAGLLSTAAIALPALGLAQEPVTTFEALNTRLRPGDKVWVTDAQGREVEGKIQGLLPEALTLRNGSARTFTAADVMLVQQREHDSLANGALIGLGIGGLGTGLACLTTMESQDRGWCLVAALVYGGVGAGVGVAIDALIPGKKLVVYRAPGATGAPSPRLSLAPLISPRAKGVAVSFAF